jgi:hypothetical protein
MQNEDAWVRLRRLLQDTKPQSWEPLWNCIRGWPDPEERRDVIVPYCVEHLKGVWRDTRLTDWQKGSKEARSWLEKGVLCQDVEAAYPLLLPGPFRLGEFHEQMDIDMKGLLGPIQVRCRRYYRFQYQHTLTWSLEYEGLQLFLIEGLDEHAQAWTCSLPAAYVFAKDPSGDINRSDLEDKDASSMSVGRRSVFRRFDALPNQIAPPEGVAFGDAIDVGGVLLENLRKKCEEGWSANLDTLECMRSLECLMRREVYGSESWTKAYMGWQTDWDESYFSVLSYVPDVEKEGRESETPFRYSEGDWRNARHTEIFDFHFLPSERGEGPVGPAVLQEGGLSLLTAYAYHERGIDGSIGANISKFSRCTLAVTADGWMWEQVPLWKVEKPGMALT